jgi:tetratricopeptide (TPR) repeat protein
MSPPARTGDRDRTADAGGDGSAEGNLPLATLMEIDTACDQFEAACRAGQGPDLATFLNAIAEPIRPRLLRELLALELDYRRNQGERPAADAYRTRFPEHAAIVDAVFDQLKPTATTRGSPHSAPRAGASQGATVRDHARPRPSASANASATDSGGGGSLASWLSHTEAVDELPHAELSPEAVAALRTAGYEILGEVGRGGMGVVYLAHKLALNRRCALKMILAGAHISPAASARFRAEAETIARLRHPAIVQIYHVGAVCGLPYFELEYLSGGSLDKRLDGIPWSALVAAELVEVLAHAIAEAHRQGIVHRDLKPANILLDADLRPKIADFGLAKMLDTDDGLTKTQTVLGSPSYMAPEQAEGNSKQVGPTTDVYALGTIFYELLTGRPPFRAATAMETLIQVRDLDPIPPSRFQPGLAQAAETICLKCLEKLPQRRYPTAEALAEDLCRFRLGESILAHPTPAWEQAWRWTRRRPALAAAAGVGVAALLLLLIGGGYYNARLRDSADKARAAEHAAVAQRNLALNAFDQLVFDVQERLGDAPATRPARRALLHTAIQGLDEIARGTEGSAPDLSRAVAHLKLGNIYRQIALAAEAQRQFELAQRLAESLRATRPHDLGAADCLRDALAGLGMLRLNAARPTEAQGFFNRVVTLAEQIVQREPQRTGARQALIEACLQLGRAHGFAAEHPEAEQWYRKMHNLAEDWVADEPDNLLARDLLSTSYRKLADERKLVEDYAAARADYLKAIAIGRTVLVNDPGNIVFKRHLGIALDDLAGVAYTQYRIDEARALFQEAETLFLSQIEADREDFDARIRLIWALSRLATLERDDLQLARAVELYRRVLDELKQLERQGQVVGTEKSRERQIHALSAEIEACSLGLAALGDLEAVRTRPPRQACLLLPLCLRVLAAQGRPSEALAAAATLCDLKLDTADDLYAQGHALAACLRFFDAPHRLDTDTPAAEWNALRSRCADQAVAVLTQALARGFTDSQSLRVDEALAPLRGHPGYRNLVDQHRGRPQPPGPGPGPSEPSPR